MVTGQFAVQYDAKSYGIIDDGRLSTNYLDLAEFQEATAVFNTGSDNLNGKQSSLASSPRPLGQWYPRTSHDWPDAVNTISSLDEYSR